MEEAINLYGRDFVETIISLREEDKHKNDRRKIEPERKVCKICNFEKNIDEFHLWGSRRPWKRLNVCKECRNKQVSDSQTTPFAYLKRTLRRYNLSLEDYRRIVDNQEGLCAICKTSLYEEARVCVDHCHSTSSVRGLLCYKCNLGLGHFNDDVTILSNAISYLKKAGVA